MIWIFYWSIYLFKVKNTMRAAKKLATYSCCSLKIHVFCGTLHITAWLCKLHISSTKWCSLVYLYRNAYFLIKSLASWIIIIYDVSFILCRCAFNSLAGNSNASMVNCWRQQKIDCLNVCTKCKSFILYCNLLLPFIILVKTLKYSRTLD